MDSGIFLNKDIISITDFTKEDLLYLCQKAGHMHQLEKNGGRYSLNEVFRRKRLGYLFFEPSTRTRTSFITAMHELGGKVDGFSGTEGTSVMKKESIRDTGMMFWANHFDVLVMRHPIDGSVQ